MYKEIIVNTHQISFYKEIKKSIMKPMRLPGSLLFFIIPALGMLVSFHFGIPYLERNGLTSFEAFIVANTIPMALLFVSAVVAVVQEQSITDLASLQYAIRTRMRFPKLTFRTFLKAAGVYLAMLVAGGVFGIFNRMLIQANWIPLPENLPLLLDPRATINLDSLTQFVGGQLEGNWGLVILFFVQLFFNIAGEELWWRGYILPRQELAFGRWTWLVHGLLWWSFHIFKWWDMLTVLPITLILSFAAQRTKNNWIPTIAHLLANSLLFLILLAGVAGSM
jgi:membrane protease YdiL (CAAX protease family)